MKKTTFIALIGLMAMAFTGCKPTPEVQTEEDYSVLTHIMLFEHPSSATYYDQLTLVENTLKDAGLYNYNEYISMSAQSKIDVANAISDKLKDVTRKLEEAPYEIHSAVFVYGIESKFLETPDDIALGGNLELLACEMIGTPDNAGFCYYVGLAADEHSCRWVKGISSADYQTSSDYSVTAGCTHELKAMLLEHSGKKDATENKFAWEEGVKYITDVIAIYSKERIGVLGAQPFELEGRNYSRQMEVVDNNGAYVYLYSTTDPVEGYEDYYLNTGVYGNIHSSEQCRSAIYEDVNELKDGPKTFEVEGHQFVERAVMAYELDGTAKGIADLSQMNGTLALYESYVLTYAKK